MHTIRTTIFTLFLLVCISPLVQAADDSWNAVKQKNDLVIGFCAQYPPFESKTASGSFDGFDVDLGKALGNYLGVPVTFKDGEWHGLIAGMNKGDYDMLITCMSRTNARKNNANFSDPYYDHPEIILVPKDNITISSRKDLADKVVGVQMSTSSEHTVESMPGLCKEIKKYNYTTEALLDLKYHRIDAVICGEPYAVMQLKKDPSFKIVDDKLKKSDIVMVLPKGHDSLTEKINKALAHIKQNGTYQKIYDKWLVVK
ncbi:ABC transporter substrate-binding protein [Desulfoplanes sp. PS50]